MTVPSRVLRIILAPLLHVFIEPSTFKIHIVASVHLDVDTDVSPLVYLDEMSLITKLMSTCALNVVLS